MTKQADKVIAFMVRQFSTVKYGYRTFVEGCYDAAINNYGLAKPEESKAEIVDAVIAALNVSDDEEFEFEDEDYGDGCEPETL